MFTTGIVAEFNPFHNGHGYLIESLKRRGDRIVCVIGDDFTQRGDVAVISKYRRAEAALRCGADLCVLLPVPWSMSCANNFAYGAVSLLKNLGCVDSVAFGSECGDIDRLQTAARALKSERFPILLQGELKTGITFAAARQRALCALIGEDSKIVEGANDTLGVEYISAAERLCFAPAFSVVRRRGAAHDAKTQSGGFLSASAIREHLLNGETDSVREYVPQSVFDMLCDEAENGKIHDAGLLETAVLSKLRSMSLDEFAALPEISEGLENRIFDAVRQTSSLEECFARIKTKRYTLARIRRIIYSAYIGLGTDLFLKQVPYIKVLGFNKTGEEIIKNAAPAVPLLVRGSDGMRLSGDAKKCFGLQCRAADLYALSCKNRGTCGLEFTEKPIKI